MKIHRPACEFGELALEGSKSKSGSMTIFKLDKNVNITCSRTFPM